MTRFIAKKHSLASGILHMVVLTLPAMASSEGHAAGFQSILYPLINFFIFFGVLSIIVRKPIMRAWSLRRETLEERLKKAEKLLEKAQEALADSQKQRASLKAEIERLQDEILMHSRQELEGIRLACDKRLEVLQSETAQKLKVQEKAAYGHIYQSVVDEIVKLAEQQIQERSSKGEMRDDLCKRLATIDKKDAAILAKAIKGEG